MITREPIILAVAVITALATFAVTRAARSRPASSPSPDSATTSLMDWLNVADDQRREIYNHDPNFGSDLKKLRNDLAAQRSALASALEEADSPDEAIASRVESVIAAGNTFERRVTRYLLTVRHHLTAEQQRRLFNLCAEGVREGPGWRCRYGAGPGLGQGGGPGGGFGPGPAGGGRGMGWGRPTTR